MKQKLETLNNCPMCGGREFSEKHEVKDHSTSQEMFRIVSCSSCGFLFTNPRPSPEAIGRFYESDTYISHTNQKSGMFGLVYQLLRKRALRMKLNWISKHTKTGLILDYGCGTGEFLNFCKRNKWTTKGIEIAEGPRKMAINNYNLDVEPPEAVVNLPEKAFDVITLWHVLEHVENPLGLTNQLLGKLKTGGLLVLALPNPESWDAIHYKQHWAAWDVPIHFYHFKKKDVSLLAEKSGLKMVETINMPFDAYYVSLLSEKYRSGKQNWIKAAISGFKSNSNSGKNNASSLTYILRKL